MNLIKPSVEIIPQEPGLPGVYKQIEIAGRTCYKSEHLITGDSAKNFVQKMIMNNHTAVLEHGTVYLTIPLVDWQKHAKMISWIFPEGCPWVHINEGEEYNYVTTNFRHIYTKSIDIEMLKRYMYSDISNHEKRVTVRFICDRGVSHELVRHRVFSFAQESTRYCNYSRDKFGNQITCIEPLWIDDERKFKNSEAYANAYERFTSACEEAEGAYLDLLDEGFTAQQARQVLPTALKTEVVMTGFVKDWKYFFKLRCAKDAHPDMRYLATQLEEMFNKRGLFNINEHATTTIHL